MTDLKQLVVINKPIQDVFGFCIDPANTPKWVDSIVKEQTDEWPVKLGTLYRNLDRSGVWSEYELTMYKPTTAFTLSKADGGYLRYRFTEQGPRSTELTYNWNGDELEESSLALILMKLKTVIEEL